MTQVHESPFRLDIPPVDLPTFVFDNKVGSRSQPQYFNADNPAEHFSLAQAEVWVKRLAKGLLDHGLRPNDKVMLVSGNSLYFPVLFWGVLASGAVFTGCSPSSSVDEITYQLRDSDSKVLLADPACLEHSMRAAANVGLPPSKVFIFSNLNDDTAHSVPRRWTDLWSTELSIKNWNWRKLVTKEEAQSATAVINYSSGTTGVPKGVEISHYNIVANSLQVAFKRNMVANTPAGRARKQRIDMSGERWLAPLPMFHAYGQAYYCTTAAISGCKVFIMPRYNIRKYLLYLDIYRITFLTGVPTILVSLAKHPEASSFNLKAIEAVVTGSAPLNPEIGSMVQETYLRPGVQVEQGWGLTETTCSATGFAPDDEDDGRSIGWLNPNMRAKIVPIPEHGFDAEHASGHTIGEIWISGPNVMMGYYKRPDDTASAVVMEGGLRWFKTGDIGYVDKQGRLYIVDRLKELIKVKGLQVAPAEIEQTLLTHSGIKDAAVIGAPRKDSEYPKAFVVRQDGAEGLTEREVQQYIEERLSKHKWLTAGVEFVEDIPRTASGKIMRRLLKKKLAKL